MLEVSVSMMIPLSFGKTDSPLSYYLSGWSNLSV